MNRHPYTGVSLSHILRPINQLFRSVHSSAIPRWGTLPSLSNTSVSSFRHEAFIPEKPVCLPIGTFSSLPANSKWFTPLQYGRDCMSLDFEYLNDLGDPTVPVELTATNSDGSTQFLRGEQPLSYFLSWMKLRLAEIDAGVSESNSKHAYPQMQQAPAQPSLYLAQCPLSLLPHAMRQDLPVPEVVLKAGKGDIYDSSLWMGVPPTVTPLHCDPNPNLLVQLAGEKAIRLLGPRDGKGVVEEVRGRSNSGNMRGEEMMQGEERKRLEEMIWGEENDSGFNDRGYEIVLKSGEGLFIPKGWWHAVRGLGNIGVSASVNWWFR